MHLQTRTWPERSHLFVVGDGFAWSIDEDAHYVAATARRLGYEIAPSGWARYAGRQSVFLPSHFTALEPRWLETTHDLGLAYFHGRPGTSGYPEFDDAYRRLRDNARRIARIQVTHEEMRTLVLGAGVEPDRVFKIRLGVDTDRFGGPDAESRHLARSSLGVPTSAFVVGSFQKDGVGLGEGFEPKLIKGPDVLLATLERLSASVPDLFVLLTGLARGYVCSGLEQLGIPYRHVLFRTHDELPRAYHALDAYLVTSRQEGGPKGPLEAMATGVPVATTRVGQAQELVEHERNGLLADVEDVDALTHAIMRLHDDAQLRQTLVEGGRSTANANDAAGLIGEWASLLEGFVKHPAPAGHAPSPAPQAARPASEPATMSARGVPFATRPTVAFVLLLVFIFVLLPEILHDHPYDVF